MCYSSSGYGIIGTCSSDERLKNSITSIATSTDARLQAVLNLNPVTFKWNGDPSTTYAGFIAQDVMQQIPLAVRTNPDGYFTRSTYDHDPARTWSGPSKIWTGRLVHSPKRLPGSRNRSFRIVSLQTSNSASARFASRPRQFQAIIRSREAGSHKQRHEVLPLRYSAPAMTHRRRRTRYRVIPAHQRR